MELIDINFLNGPFVEIKEGDDSTYLIEFIDSDSGDLKYSTHIKNNMWAKCSIQYYLNWNIKIWKEDLLIYNYYLNLKNKKIIISIDSSSLGDTLAWMPYAEEFRKKHNCELYLSTFKNELFKDKYENLNFIKPGENINDVYAIYKIGLYYNEDNTVKLNMNPIDPKKVPMQKICSDILGLKYNELVPKLNIDFYNGEKDEKLITIGIHSTAQAKYWNNPNGWQELVDWLVSEGYVVKILSNENDGYMGNFHPKGAIKHPTGGIEGVMLEMLKSKLFIGIGSGLSWLSWSLGVKTVLISGFSYEWTEMSDCIRIGAPAGNICSGCFNRVRLDPGDWNWCPDHKGTTRQFECSKLISSDIVIDKLKKVLL